ncbi:unnamed protein product, partial [Mesorhabditis spiculigera]
MQYFGPKFWHQSKRIQKKKREKVLANLAFQHIYVLYQWADCDEFCKICAYSGHDWKDCKSKYLSHAESRARAFRSRGRTCVHQPMRRLLLFQIRPHFTVKYAIHVVALGKTDETVAV